MCFVYLKLVERKKHPLFGFTIFVMQGYISIYRSEGDSQHFVLQHLRESLCFAELEFGGHGKHQIIRCNKTKCRGARKKNSERVNCRTLDKLK